MMAEPVDSGPPLKKRICKNIFHSTPAKTDFTDQLSSTLASPLLHDSSNKQELYEDCGILEASFNASIECDNSHYFETLCTGCGKLPGDSILSQHSHSELECGDICHICGQFKNVNSLSVNQDEQEFLDLYRLASARMNTESKPNVILELTRIIANGKFDLNGLTFDLFWDTIKAIASNSLTTIRYSQKSKTFWKFFMEKFGGAAIRALTGWKMIGSLLSGQAEPGYLSGSDANLILSVPCEDILKHHDPYNGNWPRHIPPGICEEVVNRLKIKHSETSICLAFDGKKLAPGLKDRKGDINLLGKETDGLTVEKKHELHEADLQTIKVLMESVITQVASVGDSNNVSRSMTSVITLLSQKQNSLEQLIQKKRYSVDKLKQRGGDDFVKSKYAYAISMLTALLLELEDIRRRNNRCRETLAEKCAMLNHMTWPRTTQVAIATCQFLPLNQSSVEPKQGTDAWFDAREKASATGSRLWDAVGCAGLGAQKSYFHEKRGKFKKTFSDTAIAAMNHGKKHEVCALATYCSKVVPCFFPDCIVKETGGIHFEADNLDLIISPDGLLYNPECSIPVAAIEIKCPFSAGLHQEVPDRYYLQIQAEMVALNVDLCHFVSWTDQSTRVFLVKKDNEVWQLALNILTMTFGKHVKKCPSRLTLESKKLKTKIKEGIKQNARILCEFNSLHACVDNFAETLTGDVQTSCSLVDLKTCILDVSEDALSLTRKQYQATRQKATEVITFVAGDLDRLWSEDQIHGVPVGYFLRGYSLPVTTVGDILEKFLTFCHAKSLHIPITCFDGQFMKLLQQSREGYPLTLMEVQKQYWNSVTKKTKTQILNEFKACNVNTAKIEVDLTGRKVVTSKQSHLPATAVQYLKEFCQEKKQLPNRREVLEQDIAQDIQDVPAELVIEDNNCDELFDIAKDTGMEEQDQITEIGGEEEEEGMQDLTDNYESNTNVSIDIIYSKSSPKLTDQDFKDLLLELSTVSNTWSQFSSLTVAGKFESCESVSKFSTKELNTILKFLRDYKHMNVKVSGTKPTLLKEVCRELNVKGCLPEPKIRKRNPVNLKTLSARSLQSKHYPKHALNISYANWKFSAHVDEWRKQSRIDHGIDVKGLQNNIEWFYVPEWSTKRQQLEVKKIDPHHLLTRHRSALCKRDIGFARRADFMSVAESGHSQLKPGMMEDRLNMQSTDYALITFSAEVEQLLSLNGKNQSAELCKMVREWFQSCDEPGIDAEVRCQQKWRYRNYLLSLVDLMIFPPPGMYIRGYPKQLWEATIASIEADVFLYGLSKRRSYNSRAVSSQNCEALYSSLAALPGSQNGVPTCISLESNMAKLCGESLVRLDPNRGFPLRLSSAPVYPQSTLTESEQPLLPPEDPQSYIHSITLQNHPFDAKARKRTARHKPSGLSGLHEPARGVSGVRIHHKVDESRIDPLIRLGKRKNCTS